MAAADEDPRRRDARRGPPSSRSPAAEAPSANREPTCECQFRRSVTWAGRLILADSCGGGELVKSGVPPREDVEGRDRRAERNWDYATSNAANEREMNRLASCPSPRFVATTGDTRQTDGDLICGFFAGWTSDFRNSLSPDLRIVEEAALLQFRDEAGIVELLRRVLPHLRRIVDREHLPDAVDRGIRLLLELVHVREHAVLRPGVRDVEPLGQRRREHLPVPLHQRGRFDVGLQEAQHRVAMRGQVRLVHHDARAGQRDAGRS